MSNRRYVYVFYVDFTTKSNGQSVHTTEFVISATTRRNAYLKALEHVIDMRLLLFHDMTIIRDLRIDLYKQHPSDKSSYTRIAQLDLWC